MIPLIRPRALKKGDKVAVVSLSWGGASIFPHRYKFGINELIKHFCLEVKETLGVLTEDKVLHDSPQIRASNLMDAFLDPQIKAIISTIGGDDAIRILPFVDFSIIRNNPKIFMGYSDTTANHFMCLKAGLGSFYGPSIMSGFAENGGMSEYSILSVRKSLFCNRPVGRICQSEHWSDEFLSWNIKSNQDIKRKQKKTKWIFLQGKKVVQGNLIGGCMEVLEMLKGTCIFPDVEFFKNTILFLEVSNKVAIKSYLSYWLRNYGAMGILNIISGIIFGRLSGGEREDNEKFAEIVKNVLNEFSCNTLPVIIDMDFGHTDPMFVIPYGCLAEIDPVKETFSILESAVI